MKRPRSCDLWAAVDQFRSLFEEHEAEQGYASAMANCYEFAIDSGVLPVSERRRAAEIEEKGDGDA